MKKGRKESQKSSNLMGSRSPMVRPSQHKKSKKKRKRVVKREMKAKKMVMRKRRGKEMVRKRRKRETRRKRRTASELEWSLFLESKAMGTFVSLGIGRLESSNRLILLQFR